MSLETKVPRRRQHVKKGDTPAARGRGTDCHTSDIGHWFAMTGISGWFAMTGVLRRGRGDGDADCHGSDIGDWFGMTTLWQSEVRRETDSHASDIEDWFGMTGGTGLARNGGSGAG